MMSGPDKAQPEQLALHPRHSPARHADSSCVLVLPPAGCHGAQQWKLEKLFTAAFNLFHTVCCYTANSPLVRAWSQFCGWTGF